MIQKASLRLLQRPAMSETVISDEIYRKTSLSRDLEEAGNPEVKIDGPLLMNILVKFFHAYVYPGSHEEELRLQDVSLLFDQFVHRRLGSDVLENCASLRKDLLAYGFALCMLADLSKSAHIFKVIAESRTRFGGEIFTGLDIGSGTGILMLAMSVQAKRNGFSGVSLVGIERNQIVADRTNDVLGRMGLGNVLVADAKKADSYGFLENKKLHYITNETLPGVNRSLWKEDFIFICKTLFEMPSSRTSGTSYFPEAVLVGRSPTEMLTILNSANGFQLESEEYPLRLMKPYAISLSGTMTPLESVGSSYEKFISGAWSAVLTRRW
ncbi:hypothetical protein [Maridesulfovibrio hydrothermalis]|uniref:Uncharacterized protein n=1 Tax=Maridesulfovibrio hydrothermalis AM13 = DSM 14728 TaxID=1121451 RepID=L0R814_9BACT|nr:hypothetical protein [Maridesulfovibrio hydrothermalis]CCO22883.1 conserved protein of unknown function [Maridesulfovibrio hydrothermalis AM13 = DSM 14728]